jgi:phosphohistidine phosphatase SixA
LYERLRAGGYVIFMRHAKTEVRGAHAYPLDDPADCARQRKLSPAGREASPELRTSIEILTVPIGEVKSSPMCRARETAELAFGKAVVGPRLAVGPANMAHAARDLEALLAPPAPGTNDVLVGHLFSALFLLNVRLEEGEAVVLEVPPGERARIAGRITATQWGDLTRDWLAHGDQVFAMARRMAGPHAPSGHGGHDRGAPDGDHGAHRHMHP